MVMNSEYSWIDDDTIADIDLAGDYLRQNFAKILPEWARNPPFYVMQNGSPQLVCSRYEDVHTVLNDAERFSTVRPQISGDKKYVQYKPDKFSSVETLPQMDGEKHARIRRLIAAPFSAPAIARMTAQIDAALEDLVESIEIKEGCFDLMSDFARELMVVALLDTVLNLNKKEKDAFVRMNLALPLTASVKPGEPFPKEYHEAFEEATRVINSIIDERRRAPGKDLISQLILTRDGGDVLSDKELFDLIFTFSAAALESTAASMGAIMLTLFLNPDVFDRIKQDSSLIPDAIDECLRLHGPGIIIVTRYALQDTTIGGVFVPRGVPVYVATQAANYDPDKYDEPLVFKFARKDRKIMTFGSGIHFCAGSRLAKYVLHSGLIRLLDRYPKIRLKDSGFVPHYFGAAGETQLSTLPVRVD